MTQIELNVEKTFEEHPENLWQEEDCPYCARLQNKLIDLQLQKGNQIEIAKINVSRFSCRKHAALQSFHHTSLNFTRYCQTIDVRKEDDFVIVEGDGHIPFVYLRRRNGEERLVLPHWTSSKTGHPEDRKLFTFIPTERERQRLAEIIVTAMKYNCEMTLNTNEIEVYDLILRLVLQEAV